MKIFYFVICFLATGDGAFAQHFSELKGMEDYKGNTNLFYRIYEYEVLPPSGFSERRDIYKLDIADNSDTLFLEDYTYYPAAPYMTATNLEIYNFDFWDNDPSKYIFTGVANSFEPSDMPQSPTTFIKRFDSENLVHGNISGGAYVEIARNDDSLLYASNGMFIKSTDGGWNWIESTEYEKFFRAVSSWDDSTLFFIGYGGLLKSTDAGATTFVVDTSFSEYLYNQSDNFYFDKNQTHVYKLFGKNKQFQLRASDNRGDAFSWSEIFSDTLELFVSIDQSQAGHIYLARDKFIYKSMDFGNTFNIIKELDRKLVGIYKKPNSEKLYAATKYDLYEIRPDTMETLKHLNIDPDISSWYPLEIGNKWFYSTSFCPFAQPCSNSTYIIEIIDDTTMLNGFNYSIVKKTNSNSVENSYERYNELDGTIKRYTEDNSFINNEYIIEELTAEVGDTLCSNLYEANANCDIPRIFTEEINVSLFDSIFQKRKYEVNVVPGYKYSLVRGIGIDHIFSSFIEGSSATRLKGCLINGIVYGDTTLVGIDDEENQPKSFYLSQNYPNPFNPTTKIAFRIAKSGFVSVKIYDVLGNEVATLVNQEKSPGEYEVEFSAAGLASGLYFYKLTAGTFSETKKMLLLK